MLNAKKETAVKMKNGLTGKTALVTGASRGIGRAVAQRFAECGAQLVICSRDITALREEAGELADRFKIPVVAVQTDLTKPDDIKNMVREAVAAFGSIHILVNNTGGPPPGFFLDFDDNHWYDAFTLNLMSVIRSTREVIPLMKEQKWGRIINLISVAIKTPIAHLVLSNTIRSAIPGLTSTLAGQLAPYHILINNVCPGYTATERVEKLAGSIASQEHVSPDEVKKRWTDMIPLGRLAEPEEIASLVVFLATDEASYITGQTITVDGGFHRGVY